MPVALKVASKEVESGYWGRKVNTAAGCLKVNIWL
jgi:hypothetical protein